MDASVGVMNESLIPILDVARLFSLTLGLFYLEDMQNGRMDTSILLGTVKGRESSWKIRLINLS